MTFDDEVQKINRKKLEEMMGQGSRTKTTPAPPSVKPVELDDANFYEVVRSHPLVVVDFWAPWCGPCRVVSPVLEQLASEMAGQATFGKLNVDDNPMISQKFGIQGIPTIMVFKDGQPVDGIVGAAPKQMIEARITPHFSGGGKGSPYQ
jgi:thioredoxin 1